MQVIEWPQFLQNGLSLGNKLTSMTVGIFDGVHRGHQALIKRIVSHNSNTSSACYVPTVVTFRENHKTEIREQKDIQNFQQRLTMFEKLGIQITIIIDFNEEFKQMPGIDFLNLLLKHGRVGFFAAGSDFRCGYKLDTDAAVIKIFFASHDIPVKIVPQVMKGRLPISSSRIRTALAKGDFPLAEAMLGYTKDYSFLAGKIGITESVLQPSGTILINDEIYDVKTEGEFVEMGRGVKVTHVRGRKIFVKRV
jgi:riboflavin kinase/FMN adenylyltransferase